MKVHVDSDTQTSKAASLIVGLGNPGSAYTWTRHNFGYLAIEAFAHRHHATFKLQSKFYGKIAKIEKRGNTLYLLQPTTYMNASGRSVKAICSFFNIPSTHILVLADDLHLPFLALRLRLQGSSGGHNGLKDIENTLKTQEFARLKLGIDSTKHGSIEDYVLQTFSSSERQALPKALDCAAEAIELWLTKSSQEAMSLVNAPGFCMA